MVNVIWAGRVVLVVVVVVFVVVVVVVVVRFLVISVGHIGAILREHDDDNDTGIPSTLSYLLVTG